MNKCCICRSKDIAAGHKSILFTDKNGREKAMCRTCGGHIETVKNTVLESGCRDSITYLLNLCYTKKLTDPKVVGYLNESVLHYADARDKLPVVKTDIIDIIIIIIKIVKWTVAAALPLTGLVIGASFFFAPVLSPAFAFIIMGGILFGAALIAFTFFGVCKLLEEWLLYSWLVRDYKKKRTETQN